MLLAANCRSHLEYFVDNFWTYINMVLSQACRQLTRDTLLACNGRYRCVIDQRTRDVVSCLQLRRRGCRAGDQYRHRVLAAQSVTLSVGRPSQAGEIQTVIGNRRPSDVNTGQLFHGCRDVRVTASKTVPRRSFMAVSYTHLTLPTIYSV